MPIWQNDERGQVIVEFALALPIFLLVIYGLITLFMWGTAAIFAQDIADDVARKYAVTLNKPGAESLGQTYLGRWAYMFINPDRSSIEVKQDGQRALAKVSVTPRIQKLYLYEMDKINRSSSCVLEEIWRNTGEYD